MSKANSYKDKTKVNNNVAKPFLLKPTGKDYLWGGQRLNDDFNKEIALDPLAETWECSTHPDGESRVEGGIFNDLSLNKVLQEHPEFIGIHPRNIIDNGLPIIIKLIDARERLSVQVHPSDEYARKYEHGQLGKSEMWYVIDADRDASLVFGFRDKVTKEQIRDGIENGRIEKYLQYVPVRKGDVFFVQAGTVHAIGAGIVLAEIQENSNLTYRLYDYNRIDKDGKKRELHLEKALDVLRLESSKEPRQPIRKLQYRPGYASELIGRCKYFEVERVLINTECVRSMAAIQTGSESFNALLCIDGCADLFGEDTLINIFKGDCIFIPANSIPLKLHGKAEFLKIRC